MVSLAARAKISVVIPMLNEERNIPALLDRLFRVLSDSGEAFEVLCVDDGSKDGTLRLLGEAAKAHPELKVVSFARNFGQHAAIIAGFDASSGDWVITIDADLQNPPEEIPRLLAEFRKGHDLIGTYREGRQDSFFRKTASWMVNRLMRKFSKIEIRDFGCMLRGYSGEVAHAIASRCEYKTFIPALGTLYAGNPTEIPVSHAKRAAGRSNYSVLRLVSLALDLVTCFSLWPLRMLFLWGCVVSFLGILFGFILLALRLYRGADWAAQGVFTLFAIVFIFIGAQFIAFGLLGEYIGRIFQEVRERPPYVLRRPPGAALGRRVPQERASEGMPPGALEPEEWSARSVDQERVSPHAGRKSLDDGGS
jgi:undecaprenyl-phosphate 4-deoxy-4-formamido-L-arabinose transferase